MNNQIVVIDVDDLVPADWNYKTNGTQEEIEKLLKSIEQDGSAGIPAVRELDNKFEVIDGNHRLQAVIELGWNKIYCENFGDISKAKAITIARRRNHKWFDDDMLKYAKIFKDDVLTEFTKEELSEYMPDSLNDMYNLEKLLDFDWQQFDADIDYEESDGARTIKIIVLPQVYDLWLKWLKISKELMGYESESKALEFALIEAINVPKESVN